LFCGSEGYQRSRGPYRDRHYPSAALAAILLVWTLCHTDFRGSARIRSICARFQEQSPQLALSQTLVPSDPSEERPKCHVYARHMVAKVLKPSFERESFFSARRGGQVAAEVERKGFREARFYRRVEIRTPGVRFVGWTPKAFWRVLRSVPQSSIIARGRTRVGGLRRPKL
jgi:hypothetical protein